MATAFAFAIADTGASDAETSFTIKDYKGNDVKFDGPAKRVIVFGYGFALTISSVGQKEKIVACEKSTADYLKDYNGYEAVNLNVSMYASNAPTQLKIGILQLASQGKFDLSKDWIITTSADSIVGAGKFIDEMNTTHTGQYNIMVFSKGLTTYDDISNNVRDVAKIVGGDASKAASNMAYVKDKIAETITKNNLKDVPFIHLSSTKKVYNSSILVSMASNNLKGVNIGYKSTITKESYDAELSELIQVVGAKKAIIFTDASYNGDLAALKTALPNCKVVKMTREGNNYCAQAADGLWTVASAMYPDYFSGETPQPEEKKTDNTLIYVCCGIVGAVAIGAIAIYVMRRP